MEAQDKNSRTDHRSNDADGPVDEHPSGHGAFTTANASDSGILKLVEATVLLGSLEVNLDPRNKCSPKIVQRRAPLVRLRLVRLKVRGDHCMLVVMSNVLSRMGLPLLGSEVLLAVHAFMGNLLAGRVQFAMKLTPLALKLLTHSWPQSCDVSPLDRAQLRVAVRAMMGGLVPGRVTRDLQLPEIGLVGAGRTAKRPAKGAVTRLASHHT